jgi:hypothetical protein
MTKNLASSKSATLRDKWRLRRYLSPDGKVFFESDFVCFLCNRDIWHVELIHCADALK